MVQNLGEWKQWKQWKHFFAQDTKVTKKGKSTMNDYYEDEYYEDYEDDDLYEVVESSVMTYLCKAQNGHLYVEQVVVWRVWSQSWGETVEQRTVIGRISDLVKALQPVAIRTGRNLKPGERIEFEPWFKLWNEQAEELDDDGVYEGDVVIHQPYDDDDIPF